MLKHLLIVCLAIFKASAFTPTSQGVHTMTRMEMTASAEGVDRRTLIADAISAVAVFSAGPAAFALNSVPADNEIVKEQRTVTKKLDVNNSAVADYMQYPGLYPTIGGKVANNGPYNSVKDVLKLKLLTSAEKNKLKEYESQLIATPSTGLDTMRGRDPYRTSFNSYKEVKPNVMNK